MQYLIQSALPPTVISQLYKTLALVAVLAVIQLIAVFTPTILVHGVPYYLGLHTLLELLSVVIAVMVFIVGWNNKNINVSSIIIMLSCAFLLVGIFDMMHALSYNGMPDFLTPSGSQKHLTFWMAARLIGAVALFVASLKYWPPFENYKQSSRICFVLTGIVGISILLIGLYGNTLLPTWFIAGVGLTDEKVFLEYLIIALHFLAAVMFIKNLKHTNNKINTVLLFGATLILGIGEIYFTLYTTMVGGYNILGHIYKVIAYFFIYRALIVQVFEKPFKELEEYNAKISHMANYDSLTNLPNRQLFNDRVTQAIKSSIRSKQTFALLFLDLDHFKNVNDTLGHAIGDKLLVEVGKRLSTIVREQDTVARIGGDEFVLLIQDVDSTSASIVAKNIITLLSEQFDINGNKIKVTPSIGIAVYWHDGRDFETLYQHADIAMYKAKKEGRNNFAFFTQEMQDAATRAITVENALRAALKNDELYLVYQPQISLKDNSIIGAEALLRWNNISLGNVSPATFIPIAETSGQIIDIGEWVIKNSLNQIKDWNEDNLNVGVIAINISAVQFKQAGLHNKISDAIKMAGVDSAHVEIELTESVAMDAENGTVEAMNNLFCCGIKMSIDDFGTGYSSLSMLKKFKVYKIKIDQSFVRDITNNDDDKAIVSAIIEMSHKLGFTTIAEGVETKEQLELLRKLGCDEAQGYYISRPVSPEKFKEFVLEYNARQEK